MTLTNLQNSLILKYGNFSSEIIEQTMVYNFLDANSKVLELGSNIGRNSLIISKILNDSSNLVTLEMDSIFYNYCLENKNLNNLNFNIENAAMSYKPLYYQEKPHGEGGGYCVLQKFTEDYKLVKTVTFEEIEQKYNICFDTIVCDCEGGFYFIIKDNPNVLQNIKTLIIENDFSSIEHKNFLNELLLKFNFERIFVEPLKFGNFPCKDFFWETWKKKN
jgi:hypothetical protein